MADIKGYFRTTWEELVHKVSWPTWSELQSSAILVLVASIVIALLVALMDYVFGINNDDSLWRGFIGFFYDMVGPSTGAPQ